MIVRVRARVCVCVCVCVSVSVSVSVCVRVCVCSYVCIGIYLCVCIHACMCVDLYVHVYTCARACASVNRGDALIHWQVIVLMTALPYSICSRHQFWIKTLRIDRLTQEFLKIDCKTLHTAQ